MKPSRESGSNTAPATVGRRGALLGAGAAAAAGAVAVVAARSGAAADAAPAVAQAKADDAGGGYRLTDHVRRYYDTART